MYALTAVLVTYNSKGLLHHCLDPLYQDNQIQIVVIDNNSEDGTVEYLKSKYPKVLIKENQENLGFARAVNQGVELADSDLFLLLNPDARIENSFVHDALTAFESNDNIGIMSPFVVEGDGVYETLAAGRFPTLFRIFNHASGLYKLSKLSPIFEGHYLSKWAVEPAQLLELDWVSGACMFVQRKAWQDAGGMSERWFMYAEDIDLCFKVKKLGYKVCLNTSLEASHMVGSSSGDRKEVSVKWLINLFDFYSLRMSRTGVARALWKYVVSLGFYGRYLFSLFTFNPNSATNKRRFRSYATALLTKKPMTGFVQYYPVARVAHVERIAQLKDVSLFYTKTRGDWDQKLADENPRVHKVGFAKLAIDVLFGRLSHLEIPEPFALKVLPQTALIASAVTLRNALSSKKINLVTYAIENLAPDIILRGKFKLSHRLSKQMCLSAAMFLMPKFTKIAFGTQAALDNYRVFLGELNWNKIQRDTKFKLFSPLEPPAQLFIPTRGYLKDPFAFIFIGTTELRKGLNRLARVWDAFHSENPETSLFIVTIDDAESLFRNEGSSCSGVSFFQNVPRNQISELLSRAHVLVSLSKPTLTWKEQIGLTNIEGLSHGCEIISTDSTAIADWLNINQHQVLTEAFTDAELMEALFSSMHNKRNYLNILNQLPSRSGRQEARLWMES